MPEGRVNSGDFREGTPITAGHTFGTPVTVPPNDGNIEPQSNSTLDSNPITWVPSPALFGIGTGFSMQATPPVVNIARGNTGTTTVTITSLNAAPATVTLTYSGAPVGVSIAFGTNPTTGTSVATLTVGAGVTQGKYTITIVGTATPEVENTNIHLVVF